MDNKSYAKIFALALAVLLIGVGMVIALKPYYTTVPVPTVTPIRVTSGLLASYTIGDSVTGALVTSGVTPQWFSASAGNPLSLAFASTASPVSAAYVSSVNAWQSTGLSTGSWQLVIGASATYYPLVTTVGVSTNGVYNNAGQPIGIMNPASFSMVERATPTVTASLKTYDTSTKLYDIVGTTNPAQMNTTTYNKFQITYTLSVGGVSGQQLLAGEIYLPVVTGLSITGASASWSSGSQVSVILDTTGTTTGLTGYTIAYPTLSAGNSYTVTVNVQTTSSISDASATTFGLTLHDALAIENPTYRYWSDPTCTTITYKAV